MDNFVKCLKPGGQLIITFDMVLRYGEKDLGFYMGEPEIREMLASLGIEYFKPAQFMTNTYEGGVVITALCLQIQF
jgi:hypothetical protein